MSTLEDVFVAISTAEEKKLAKDGHGHSSTPQYGTAEDGALESIGGEPFAALMDRAATVTYGARTWSQTKTIFKRKWTLLKRSRRTQLMILMFPLFFLLLAFLSIQPQQVKNSGIATRKQVDPTDFNMVLVSPRDNDANHEFADILQEVFTERFKTPMKNLFVVEKYGDFASGMYLPVKSVSFITGFQSPEMPGGMIIHQNSLIGAAPAIDLTLLWNPEYDAGFSAPFAALVKSAAERMAGNSNATFGLNFGSLSIPTGLTGKDAVDFNPTKTYNVMQVGMYMVLSIGQIIASVSIPVADEVSRQVYHTNLALGMTPLAYFLGNFLFDLLMCVYPFVLFVLGILWKDMESYFSGALPLCLFAGMLFCAHAILHAYIFMTYMGGLKPYVYTVMIHAFNLVTMGGPYLIDVLMNSTHFTYHEEVKPYLLSLFPSCSWYHIIDNTSDFDKKETSASAIFTFTGIRTGWGFIFLIFELIVPITMVYYFAVNRGIYRRWSAYRERVLSKRALIADAKAIQYKKTHGSNGSDEMAAPLVEGSPVATPHEDSDVAAERQRVEATDFLGSTTDMAVLRNLRKQYGQSKVAVQDLSLGIRRGECFGLLGPNGAGKSTACKLILRQIDPTSGDVIFPYGDVNSHTSQDLAFQTARLGVCQQTDTLWEYLSAAEHMDQYLAMRLTTQYKPELWGRYIERTIERVQLAEAGSKQAGGYSGGMKRKLQVCLAMYTGARSIFLDEPSTGMDPFARRALWKVILDACSHDACVVLTTHSMEEAEAVCSRISIITHGSLQCIGTTQHLKNKFGSGYVFTITFDPARVNPKAIADLKQACRGKFGATFEVKEELGNLHRYGVKTLNSLAEAFRFLNQCSNEYAIEQYSVTQTASLEQIFLSFVSSTRDH